MGVAHARIFQKLIYAVAFCCQQQTLWPFGKMCGILRSGGCISWRLARQWTYHRAWTLYFFLARKYHYKVWLLEQLPPLLGPSLLYLCKILLSSLFGRHLHTGFGNLLPLPQFSAEHPKRILTREETNMVEGNRWTKPTPWTQFNTK